MTAASKWNADESSCRVKASRRPGPYAGKANVLGEATGVCTLGAAGAGVQTRGERLAEITSGRSSAQQGLAATCKDHPCEANAEAEWRVKVWRMSPYERRRRGNALPGGNSSLPRGGNTGARQRGSGRLAVPGWLSDTEPRHSRPIKRGRDDEQTSDRWGVCGPVLKPRHVSGRLTKESQGQNRTGEIPPSGIVGGLAETWTRWEPE